MKDVYHMLFDVYAIDGIRPMVRTALWCGHEYSMGDLADRCHNGYGALFKFDVVAGKLLNERLLGVIKSGEKEGEYSFTPASELTPDAT